MKPNIDLKNPLTKKIINIYSERVLKALNAKQTVEKSVIPIYHIPDFKRKPIQIASGVLVRIKKEYFIFSASHVFDQIGSKALLTGDGVGGEILCLPGERFSSPKGNSGTHSDDIIDASVYRIQCKLPRRFKRYAITLDDFDNEINLREDSIYLSVGFRVKRSNTSSNNVHSYREAFPTREVNGEVYKQLGLNPEINIVLWYEEQMLLDGKWQNSPIPRGFSGGAIIEVIKQQTFWGIKYKQKLVGIVTEHRKKNKDLEGVLIGTRTTVHLAAIKKFMPEII